VEVNKVGKNKFFGEKIAVEKMLQPLEE